MKIIMTLMEPMINELWLSFKEGTAVVQSCFAIDKATIEGMTRQR